MIRFTQTDKPKDVKTITEVKTKQSSSKELSTPCTDVEQVTKGGKY